MVEGDGYGEAFGLSLLALVGGIAGMIHGFRRRKQRNLMQETPTQDIESLSVGVAEVNGTATTHPEHGTIPAPFSNEECLVAQWEIEEYESDDDGGHWRSVAHGVESVPFYIDDGTGKLLVDPHQESLFDVKEHTEPQISVDADEEPPGPVREFIQREPSVGVADEPLLNILDFGTAEGDRRYHHHLVRPDETVYAFGYVEPREGVSSPDNPANLVLRKTPEEDADLEPMFMISDKTESQLVAERKHALLWVPGGALVSTAGLAGLVFLTNAVIAVGILVVVGLVGGVAYMMDRDPVAWFFRTVV